MNTPSFPAEHGRRHLARMLACAAMLGSGIAQAAMPPEAPKAQLAPSYGRLPLGFEANQGQTDAAVRYLARGPGYALFLTGDEAVLSLRAGASPATGPTGPSAGPQRAAVLRARLLGANRDPAVTGEALQPGQSAYLIGRDPARWTTKVQRYAKVRYREVYPGIDLVYYGHGQQALEYDFVVAPAANPKRIKLRYEGVEQARLTKAGDLELQVPGGIVTLHKPVIYQPAAGKRRQPVDGRYVLERRGEAIDVAFALGRYDAGRPLVIDPVLVYSTYLGGFSHDIGYAIAVDAAGQAYVTGATQSLDFPTASPLQPQHGDPGLADVFVAKLAADGHSLTYSTYLGGSGYDWGRGIAVDAAGQAHVTGYTESPDFPTQSPLQPTLAGSDDAFVAKLAADGQSLVYGTYLGGSNGDYATGIAVDAAGQAAIAGYTSSADFPTHAALQPALGGAEDGFVAKLAEDGQSFIYATYLGGSTTDALFGVAVDEAGQVHVTGYSNSRDYPVRLPLQGRPKELDIIVSKLAADGQSLVFSTFLGGSSDDSGAAIAVDSAGQAYVTGKSFSTDFPTRFPAQAGKAGDFDAVVVKLSANGRRLAYSTYLGGSGYDEGLGIAVDADGRAHVVGRTGSVDFPTLSPLQGSPGGVIDAFVARLGTAGRLAYGSYLGGSGEDIANSVAAGTSGRVFVTGTTTSTDFPTRSPLQAGKAGPAGVLDAFITRIDTRPTSSAGQD